VIACGQRVGAPADTRWRGAGWLGGGAAAMVRAIAIVLDFISGVLFPEFISGRDHIRVYFVSGMFRGCRRKDFLEAAAVSGKHKKDSKR